MQVAATTATEIIGDDCPWGSGGDRVRKRGTSSCEEKLAGRIEAAEFHEEEEFSYSPDAVNGPARWGEIKPEWAACGKGRMQSPIDLSGPRVSLSRHHGHLNHSYRAAQATIINRGHDIQDSRYDLELHLVHESAEKEVAVIAVLYEIGAPDALLHKLEPYLEMIAGYKDWEEEVGVVDPMGARGRASVYYRYIGSLTAPPCSEGVIWTILKRVRTVSRHQLQLLREAVHGEIDNARPRQEVNNRDVSMFRPSLQNKH